MTEELRNRYEEDKIHYDIIREIIRGEIKSLEIDKKLDEKVKIKMSPIYWMFGILILIYIAVAGPLTGAAITNSSTINTKASKEELERAVSDRERDFLKKQDYYLIEDDEHRVLKEIIKNPAQSDYLIGVINDNIIKQLGFQYTTRGGKEK